MHGCALCRQRAYAPYRREHVRNGSGCVAHPPPPCMVLHRARLRRSREKAPRNPDLLNRQERETAGQAPVTHARHAPTNDSMVAGGGFEPPTFGL
jgi:hypothetical protein